MRLVILGPQGSGKGTISRLLSEEFGLPHVDVGHLLREAERRTDVLGRLIKKTIDAGKLLPDKVVNRIVRTRLEQKDVAAGLVLDGYPRTLAEAEFLDSLVELDAVVVLEVSDAVAVKRLSGRLVCPMDGRVYGLSISPKKKGVCDSHDVKLVQRPDDTPEAIQKRLELYHEETEPLSEYYRPRNLIIRIDADRKPDAIVKDVLKRLG